MQTYLERSQKLRKHQVKSPCSSSTTSACTPPPPHQSTNKPVFTCTAERLHGKPDPLNYTLPVKFNCKTAESLALIFIDIAEEKACRHLSPVLFLLYCTVYCIHAIPIFFFILANSQVSTLQGKSLVLLTSGIFPNATPVATYWNFNRPYMRGRSLALL